jgi:hypothetical protein
MTLNWTWRRRRRRRRKQGTLVQCNQADIRLRPILGDDYIERRGRACEKCGYYIIYILILRCSIWYSPLSELNEMADPPPPSGEMKRESRGVK